MKNTYVKCKEINDDIVFCNYEYANGKILSCHGLGKKGPFPVLKDFASVVDDQPVPVTLKVFNNKYTYIKGDGSLFVVTNNNDFLYLHVLLDTGKMIGIGSFVFLYEIHLKKESEIDILYRSDCEICFDSLKELECKGIIRSEKVCDMDDIGDHDLFAQDFTINYYS